MRFSERHGIQAARDALQGRSLDSSTRNRLWSALARAIPFRPNEMTRGPTWMYEFYERLWSDHLRIPHDDIPSEAAARALVKGTILTGEWWEVYDLLEFTFKYPGIPAGRVENLMAEIQRILTEEWAGFRVLNGEFVEVTDPAEIEAIDDALEITADRFEPAREHLRTALRLLSHRQNPDYRNSIKESISAVEAVAQTISGNPKAELGAALKLIDGRTPLHGALKSGLSSLYGYTSDADGIRHALTEDDQGADAATAKFMLVVCSAFVVYLIHRAADPT